MRDLKITLRSIISADNILGVDYQLKPVRKYSRETNLEVLVGSQISKTPVNCASSVVSPMKAR